MLLFGRSDAMIYITSGSPASSGGGGSSCTQFIPSTSTCVGASGWPQSSCPTGTFNDPINFGADSSGTNDSTKAVSDAMGSGNNIKFGTAGTYKINVCQDCTGSGTPWSFCSGSGACSSVANFNSQGLSPPAGTTVECAAGVTLKWTLSPSSNHDWGMFWLNHNNVTMCGCTIQGPNSNAPAPLSNSTTGWQDLAISGSSGATVEGMTLTNSLGNGALSIFNDAGASSNVTVKYNTFQNDPLYGVVVDGEITTATIENNYDVDSTIGVEWDDCSTSLGGPGTIGSGIVFTNNLQTTVSGGCSTNTSGGASCFNPGFNAEATAGCNQSGLAMGPGNYCTGTVSIPAHIYDGVGGSGATESVVTGNTLGSNCTCSSAGGPGQTCP